MLVRRTKKKDKVCALVVGNATISRVRIFTEAEWNDEPLVFWSAIALEQFQCIHEGLISNDI
jgi:hypothetical protein